MSALEALLDFIAVRQPYRLDVLDEQPTHDQVKTAILELPQSNLRSFLKETALTPMLFANALDQCRFTNEALFVRLPGFLARVWCDKDQAFLKRVQRTLSLPGVQEMMLQSSLAGLLLHRIVFPLQSDRQRRSILMQYSSLEKMCRPSTPVPDPAVVAALSTPETEWLDNNTYYQIPWLFVALRARVPAALDFVRTLTSTDAMHTNMEFRELLLSCLRIAVLNDDIEAVDIIVARQLPERADFNWLHAGVQVSERMVRHMLSSFDANVLRACCERTLLVDVLVTAPTLDSWTLVTKCPNVLPLIVAAAIKHASIAILERHWTGYVAHPVPLSSFTSCLAASWNIDMLRRFLTWFATTTTNLTTDAMIDDIVIDVPLRLLALLPTDAFDCQRMPIVHALKTMSTCTLDDVVVRMCAIDTSIVQTITNRLPLTPVTARLVIARRIHWERWHVTTIVSDLELYALVMKHINDVDVLGLLAYTLDTGMVDFHRTLRAEMRRRPQRALAYDLYTRKNLTAPFIGLMPLIDPWHPSLPRVTDGLVEILTDSMNVSVVRDVIRTFLIGPDVECQP